MESTTFNRAELLRLYSDFVHAFGVPDETAWIIREQRKTMPPPEDIIRIAKSKRAATAQAKATKQVLIFFLRNSCGMK